MRTKGFPLPIRQFAEFLRMMQWKRERFDYTFALSPDINIVKSDLALARGYMEAFLGADEMHLRTFAVYVLFGEDRHEKKIVTL